MERKCPACGGKMRKIGDGSQIPNIPFIKIPEWIMETSVYECESCGYIALWHED